MFECGGVGGGGGAAKKLGLVRHIPQLKEAKIIFLCGTFEYLFRIKILQHISNLELIDIIRKALLSANRLKTVLILFIFLNTYNITPYLYTHIWVFWTQKILNILYIK